MRFDGTLDQLPHMLRFVCSQAQLAGVPMDLTSKIELACEEAVVNIISYAFAQHEGGEIEILCVRSPHRFEIIIKDSGPPFNPIESTIDPQFGVDMEERTIGGLGIYLIRKLMDESAYQRIGNHNVLHMAVRLDIDHT